MNSLANRLTQALGNNVITITHFPRTPKHIQSLLHFVSNIKNITVRGYENHTVLLIIVHKVCNVKVFQKTKERKAKKRVERNVWRLCIKKFDKIQRKIVNQATCVNLI